MANSRRLFGTAGASILLILIGSSMQNCSGAGGGSDSSSGDEWYYHWNCHGDSQCLTLNSACGSGPNGTCPASGTADEGPGIGGESSCNSLREFSAHFYGVGYVDSCDNSSTGGGGGGTLPPTISIFTPSSGAAGGTVTINGANFPASSSQVTVTINGAVATIVSLSTTQIVVTIPGLSPSTGQIVVTTSGGAYIAGGTFTVTGSSVPSIFWTEDNAAGAIKTVGKASGVVTTLATGLSYPLALAGDSSNLYWLEYDSMGNTSGSVKKMSKQGGTITVLATNQTDLQNTSQIAVNSSGIYWTAGAAIHRIALSGGSVSTLASGSSVGQALAVDANYVYFTADGNINKVPIGGGSVTTLATGVSTTSGNGWAFTLDSTNLYWVDNTNFSGSGTLNKVPLAGGTKTNLASSVLGYSLVQDTTNLYLLTAAIGSGNYVKIEKIAKTGGSFSQVYAVPSMYGNSMTLDNSGTLFWTENGSNTAGNIGKIGTNGANTATYGTNLYLPRGLYVDP